MTSSIKLEFNVPTTDSQSFTPDSKAFKDAVQSIVKETKNKQTTNVDKVNGILSGPTNPLYNLQPPTNVTEVTNIIFLQAQDIKNVLQRISSIDPTARCHSFPYRICPENVKLLHDNGFRTHVQYYTETQETFTEVCWDESTKWLMTIPVPS